MIRNKVFKLLFLVAFMFVFFSSCALFKRQSNKEEKYKDRVENRQIQFIYAYAEACKQKMLENYDEAENYFLIAIKANTNSAASYYFLGEIFAKRQDFQNALTFATKATELNKHNFWYKIFRSKLLKKTGRVLEAVNELKEAVKIKDNAKFAYLETAQLYLELNKPQKAVLQLEKVLEKFGITEDVVFNLYDIYVRMKDKANALKTVKKLVKYFPAEDNYKALLAEYYIAFKQYDRAGKIFEELIKNEPDNPAIRLSFSEYCRLTNDNSKFAQNLQILLNNQDIEINTKLKILVSGYPNLLSDEQYDDMLNVLVENYPNNAKAHTVYAEYLLSKNNKKEGADVLRQAVELDNSDFNLILALLELDYDIEDFDAMFNDADKQLSYYPNQPKLFFYKGFAAYKIEKYSEALRLLDYGKDIVIDDSALTAQFYLYKAKTYFELEKFDLSDKNFESLLKLTPNNYYAASDYAYSLIFRKKNLSKAKKMITKCINKSPESSRYNRIMAFYYFNENQYLKAEKFIKKSVETSHDDYLSIELYGDILHKLGKNKEANQMWKKAIKLGADKEEVQKKIKN